MRVHLTLAMLLMLWTGPIRGDTIHLRNGGLLEGKVLIESDWAVVVQLGLYARITLRPDEILKIVEDKRDGSVYQQAKDSGITRSEFLRAPTKKVTIPSGELPAVDDSTITGGTDSAAESPVEDSATQDNPYLPVSLEDIDPDMRAEAFFWLTQLTSRNNKAHIRARTNLTRLGNEVIPLVAPFVDNELERVQLFAIPRIAAAAYKPAVPDLIGILMDEDESVRASTVSALQGLSSQNFGFDPAGDDGTRERAAALWDAWWGEEEGKYDWGASQ